MTRIKDLLPTVTRIITIRNKNVRVRFFSFFNPSIIPTPNYSVIKIIERKETILFLLTCDFLHCIMRLSKILLGNHYIIEQ